MTKCNSLNVQLSNLQLNKLKSAIKNKTEVVLRLWYVILMMKIIKILQIIYQLISSYQELNNLKQYNQEDFLVDSLVRYKKEDYHWWKMYFNH